MNILVTVGTTAFDQLIRQIDSDIARDFDIKAQIADGDYEPSNMDWFRYSDSLKSEFISADLIICHAGAGTIYECLALGKRCLIVPNLDRLDKHQTEIAEYMSANNHALMCRSLSDLKHDFERLLTFEPSAYVHEPFTGVDLIRQVIGLEVTQS